MAIYAIGDVQGCYEELRALIAQIHPGPADRLWFVGDLVNRGPKSLDVLRYLRDLGSRATVVLGNHDLHLLSVAEGFAEARSDDTLDDVLAAPDRNELMDWLRSRPLMVVKHEHVLVHAGLLAQWSVATAAGLAGEVSGALSSADYRTCLRTLYGNSPDRWRNDLAGADRQRLIINALTRMRLCRPDGSMDLVAKGAPLNAAPGYLPWFAMPGRLSADHTVVCGHWSALGLHLSDNVLALDTGCVWGGRLTAIRLSDRALFDVPCAARAAAKRSQ